MSDTIEVQSADVIDALREQLATLCMSLAVATARAAQAERMLATMTGGQDDA